MGHRKGPLPFFQVAAKRGSGCYLLAADIYLARWPKGLVGREHEGSPNELPRAQRFVQSGNETGIAPCDFGSYLDAHPENFWAHDQPCFKVQTPNT